MDTNQLQLSVTLLILGLIFSGSGLLFLTPVFNRYDCRLFSFIHLKLAKNISFFRLLWPLGKTPFMIIMLGMLFFSGGSSGSIAVFSYVVIACLERGLKMLLKRPRPFVVFPEVQLSQPRKPQDPSHPSGDTLRIWYLAIVVPAAFSLSLSIFLVFCLVATLVSLGRIAFGVHFPLDVLGGMGLGLFGAGLYLLLF